MEPYGTHGPSEQQDQPAEVPAAEHIKAARTQLREGRRKEAYGILLKASAAYPTHPIILSYLGRLKAVVDNRQRSGLDLCRKAFAHFKTSDLQSAARVYPVLYLNLGMTYLAAGRKKDAFESFRKGLQYDKRHVELNREMKVLGIRKEPPVAFLSRSNIVNRVLGRLLHADPQSPRAPR